MMIRFLLPLLFLSITYTLKAQGTLDQSFGNQGVVVTPNTFAIQKSVLSSADKIISIGNFKSSLSAYGVVIAKYDEKGSLESDFGENGLIYHTDSNCISAYPLSLELLPNGSFLIGGWYSYDYVKIGETWTSVDTAFIAKYDKSGSLDNTFGQGGVKKYSFGSMSTNINSIVYTDNSILDLVRTARKKIIDGTFAAWKPKAVESVSTRL